MQYLVQHVLLISVTFMSNLTQINENSIEFCMPV